MARSGVIDSSHGEACRHIDEYAEKWVEVEVDHDVPEPHQLIDQPVEFVHEASVAPEPNLVTHGLPTEVFLI